MSALFSKPPTPRPLPVPKMPAPIAPPPPPMPLAPSVAAQKESYRRRNQSGLPGLILTPLGSRGSGAQTLGGGGDSGGAGGGY